MIDGFAEEFEEFVAKIGLDGDGPRYSVLNCIYI